MDLFIPSSKKLTAIFSPESDLNIPGDKSLSHRTALFSALASGESRITNFLDSGVTQVMLNSLSSLGVQWKFVDNILTVRGKGLYGFQTPVNSLYCGHSATTIRLMAGALAASGIAVTLDGSEGLRKRPMDRIVEPLRQLGVKISTAEQGTAPLVIQVRPAGQKLKGGLIELKQASAQVKTCILLAGLAAEETITIHEPGPSRDHTERLLKAMGADLQAEGLQVRLNPLEKDLLPLKMRLPGDISSAAFLIVAALITPNSEIIIEEVGLNPRRTGLLDVLQTMGADMQVTVTGENGGEPVGSVKVCSSELQGCMVEGDLVVRMIDEFPVFAVAAAFAKGETVVRDAQELRYKESDRIQVLCSELQKIGVDITEMEDGFVIQGSEYISGGTAESKGDHRLAMSLAVAGLASQNGVNIRGADMVSQSFPAFFEMLNRMGVEI
ncbi:MAG: 3-phosphoshikimate 1-carboxyvinyltransferase [Anaerolineaceae bacterium]|nr:3-phosphoshikimate 1-carboxyvinyltransferase [Anaerolineaceae bacterium]